MSRRTADANKAIAAAWENEQRYVSEGKGTRDWTPEQQLDILNRGKAYDENGKAFEGQHMRSVAENPECQGDPYNIQFLTREEHLAAHDGSWQNPTNWYYDPVMKTKLDFGEGPIIPCKIIDLSLPINNLEQPMLEMSEDGTPESLHCKDSSTPRTPPSPENQAQNIVGSVNPEKPTSSFTSEINTSNAPVYAQRRSAKIWKELKYIAKKATYGLLTAMSEVGLAFLSARYDSDGLSGDRLGYHAPDDSPNDILPTDDSNFLDYDTTIPIRHEDDPYPESHDSPQEHIVSAHEQRYHTKDGIVWKEKKPYSRGIDSSGE